jgi:hypothetical protein
MAQEREIYEWEVSVEIAKREKDDMIYVPRQSILTIDAELTNLRAENAELTADLKEAMTIALVNDGMVTPAQAEKLGQYRRVLAGEFVKGEER